jgi:hypothetical protein
MRNRGVKVGITSIPGIRTLPSVNTPQGDFQPPEVIDIEGSARPGDGDRQRGGRKASGAEENDQDELALETETEAGETLGEDSARSVDYFA